MINVETGPHTQNISQPWTKSLASGKKKKRQHSFNSLLDFLLFFIKESQPLGIQEGEYSFIKAHLPFYGNGNNSMPEEKAALQTHIST